MVTKGEYKSRLKAALKALKVRQKDVLSWKVYGDRVVVVTCHGQKLIWHFKEGRD
jgi:hypothetical protein